MEIEKKKCVTPKFRVSYPNVFEAKAFEDQEAKYSVVMLFDKKDDIKAVKRALHNAAVEKWGADPKKWPKFKNRAIRDGDEERAETEGYEGCLFATASSKRKPVVVNGRRDPITDAGDFYPGCYARAELLAFAYDQKGNRGVGLTLLKLQKLGDGAEFGGGKPVDEVFDEVDDGSDDEESYDADSSDEDDPGY